MSKLSEEIADALAAHGVDNALTVDEYDALVDGLAGLLRVPQQQPLPPLREVILKILGDFPSIPQAERIIDAVRVRYERTDPSVWAQPWAVHEAVAAIGQEYGTEDVLRYGLDAALACALGAAARAAGWRPVEPVEAVTAPEVREAQQTPAEELVDDGIDRSGGISGPTELDAAWLWPGEDDGPSEPLERDDLIETIIGAFTDGIVDADALWQYRVARELADALLTQYEISQRATPATPLHVALPSVSSERGAIVYARPDDAEEIDLGGHERAALDDEPRSGAQNASE